MYLDEGSSLMVSAQGFSLSVQTAPRAEGIGTLAPSSLLPLADRRKGVGQGQPHLMVRDLPRLTGLHQLVLSSTVVCWGWTSSLSGVIFQNPPLDRCGNWEFL